MVWRGLAAWCCLRRPLLPTLSSPASFSLFPSVGTHFYWRVWCPFAHLCHTQNRLLIVKIQELKKMTAQRRIKKILHCSPHSLHVINAHQAEVSLLIVSLLNMCATGCQVAAPPGAPQQGAQLCGGFAYYLAPSSWRLTRMITLEHHGTDPMIFTSSGLMYCSAIYQSLSNIDPFLNEPSLLCTMSNN